MVFQKNKEPYNIGAFLVFGEEVGKDKLFNEMKGSSNNDKIWMCEGIG